MSTPGRRVGAILSATDALVRFFGYGVYTGDEVPPPGNPGDSQTIIHEAGLPNPKILLDGGEVVWGFECWWSDEQKIKRLIGQREVELVSPSKLRAARQGGEA